MTRVLVIDDEAPIRLLCRVNLEADVLGKYVKPGDCTLVVDLTLKDFTNG